jgi:hypothetical protein
MNAVASRPQPKLDDPTFTEQVERAEVIVGGFGFGFPIAALEQADGTPINLGGFVPVRLRIRQGKLYANVQVYNAFGPAHIEVRDNRFVVRPPDWDRNSNSTALEVNRSNRTSDFPNDIRETKPN